jgi:hypothetical protein
MEWMANKVSCLVRHSQNAMNSEDYYEQGNAYRRQGNWQKALECYAEAIELDPESPAVQAREMLNSILAFYSKDALNP